MNEKEIMDMVDEQYPDVVVANVNDDVIDMDDNGKGIFIGDVDIAINNYNKTLQDFYAKYEKVETFWETDIEVVSSCGVSPEAVDVTIHPVAMAKINTLMSKFERMEWLAYLIGEGNTIIDIVIPKQEVTPVNVFVKDHVECPIIGVIHSHHDMGNSFSHTDDEYINMNHDISLCVSKGGINGQVRTKTNCNKYVLSKANVVLWDGGLNIKSFLSDVDDLITVKTFAPSSTYKTSNTSNTSNLSTLDFKDIVLYVNEYKEYIKNKETSNDLEPEDLEEISVVINILKSIKTDSFYEMCDAMFDVEFIISDECTALIDEIDINLDKMTNMDYKSIHDLLVYLEGIFS